MAALLCWILNFTKWMLNLSLEVALLLEKVHLQWQWTDGPHHEHTYRQSSHYKQLYILRVPDFFLFFSPQCDCFSLNYRPQHYVG